MGICVTSLCLEEKDQEGKFSFFEIVMLDILTIFEVEILLAEWQTYSSSLQPNVAFRSSLIFPASELEFVLKSVKLNHRKTEFYFLLDLKKIKDFNKIIDFIAFSRAGVFRIR